MSVQVNNQTLLKVETTPVLLAHVLSTPETSLSTSALHLTHPEQQNKRNTRKTLQELPAELVLPRGKLKKQALPASEVLWQEPCWQS